MTSHTTLLLLAATLSVAPAHRVDAQEKPAAITSPTSSFFDRLNQQKSLFSEFRFLTGTEVQGNPQWRGMSAQMLGTSYSFLGRPNDAIRTFPIHDQRKTPEDFPDKAGFDAVSASDWIVTRADRYRAVMVNEAHHKPQTRLLTLLLLRKLKAHGYAYFAVEALVNDGKDPLADGVPTNRTGIYTREPIFAEIIREAKRLGYQLVPYETAAGPGETQQERETGQAQAIAQVIANHPDAKVLVHAGYGHIGKTAGRMPDSARPMAMEFVRLTGLPILSIDQTSMGWEDGQASNRLATAFAITVPSVLLRRDNASAWSAHPGVYDATVLLPPAETDALRPSWLKLGGIRHQVAIDLTPCLDHLPCLVEARYASEGDDAIAADQFLMLDRSELETPLFLAPGKYRLRLTGRDDTVLTQQALDVVASTPAPSSVALP